MTLTCPPAAAAAAALSVGQVLKSPRSLRGTEMNCRARLELFKTDCKGMIHQSTKKKKKKQHVTLERTKKNARNGKNMNKANEQNVDLAAGEVL